MSSIVTTYDDLLPLMLLDLNGCDEKLMLLALRQAGRDFCKQSESWIYEFPAVNVVLGQTDYEYIAPYMSNIHRIVWVKYDNTELELEDYTFVEEKTLVLTNTPTSNITDGLEVKVILRPKISSEQLPSWFLERYAEYIMAGAKSYLMMMPSKPFTNANLSDFYKKIYTDGISIAKREVITDFKSGNILASAESFI